MKRIWIILAVLAFSGCIKDSVSKSSTNNPGFSVETLFDHDGCRVYRFDDGGNYRYFARCGSSTSTSWNEQHGKNSVPQEIITTEEK